MADGDQAAIRIHVTASGRQVHALSSEQVTQQIANWRPSGRRVLVDGRQQSALVYGASPAPTRLAPMPMKLLIHMALSRSATNGLELREAIAPEYAGEQWREALKRQLHLLRDALEPSSSRPTGKRPVWAYVIGQGGGVDTTYALQPRNGHEIVIVARGEAVPRKVASSAEPLPEGDQLPASDHMPGHLVVELSFAGPSPDGTHATFELAIHNPHGRVMEVDDVSVRVRLGPDRPVRRLAVGLPAIISLGLYPEVQVGHLLRSAGGEGWRLGGGERLVAALSLAWHELATDGAFEVEVAADLACGDDLVSGPFITIALPSTDDS